MKKNVMTVFLMVMSTLIFAQHHGKDANAMAVKMADRMKMELTLSDDQYAKVRALNENLIDNRIRIRKDSAMTQGDARNQMKSLQTMRETQLKSILTDDQWSKWTALKTKKKSDRKSHSHGKPERG